MVADNPNYKIPPSPETLERQKQGFQGNNTLIINQATMRTAVEYYLKNVVMKTNNFQVEDVKRKDNVLDTFEVTLKSEVKNV